VVYTASSNPQTTTDGTIEVYVSANTDSILDTEAKGDSFTGWTKVYDSTHANAAIESIRIGWQDNNANLSDAANSGAYFRYLALYTDEDPPCDPDTAECAWYTMHHYLVEKIDLEWNSANSKWDVRFGCWHPAVLFGTTGGTNQLRLRMWDDHATYLSERSSGGNGTNNDDSYVSFSGDGAWLWRNMLDYTGSNGLDPDTPYWFDCQVRIDTDFYKSDDTNAAVNGCIRTPPAPGASGASPVFRVSSCANEKKWGPHEIWYDGRTLPVDSTGGAKSQVRLWCGDYTYMDETNFNKSGSAKEGAETETQIKSVLFQLMHSYSYLRAANKTFFIYVGDDHDRSVNDASLYTMLEEDGSSWDRDRDGSAEAAWSDNVWGKRSVGSNNPDYGFPCAIDDGADEFQITPRALASELLTRHREIFGDIMPSSSGSYRYDPSSEDKYGANQGASGDTFDADDSHTRYYDFGNTRYIILDTRLFMDRSDTSAGTLLGPSKTFVKNAISNSTLPGLVFVLPGYVQGVTLPGVSKENDNYASGQEVSFSDERTEIFQTDVDANSSIKWFGVVCGDHHWISVDTSINGISKKGAWQLASGGAHAIRQDPDTINDTGYVLLTDAGAGSGGVVRTMLEFEVLNEQTGRTRVGAYRVADPSGSDNSLGLDTLLARTFTGNELIGPRSLTIRSLDAR